MVRAILEGRKTMTRRIVKPQPDPLGLHNHDRAPMSLQDELTGWRGCADNTGESREWKPYGQPGDRLWVRETWAHFMLWVPGPNGYGKVCYKADGDLRAASGPYDEPDRWRPSIHMPSWASRITLEVVNVRVERLWDITDEDALAEGVESWEERGIDDAQDYYRNYLTGGHLYSPKISFDTLWSKINGHESYNANPWVWVVEFRRLTP